MDYLLCIKKVFFLVQLQGRSLWGARGALRPLLLKILLFLNTKSEKSIFSGLFSHSIYVKIDITPPLLWTPSYAPVQL
jgi:hypothetical protein